MSTRPMPVCAIGWVGVYRASRQRWASRMWRAAHQTRPRRAAVATAAWDAACTATCKTSRAAAPTAAAPQEPAAASRLPDCAPLSPPSLLSAVSMVAGDMRTPSSATGSPASNSMSTYVGLPGAASGDTERVNMLSSASTHGSSRALLERGTHAAGVRASLGGGWGGTAAQLPPRARSSAPCRPRRHALPCLDPGGRPSHPRHCRCRYSCCRAALHCARLCCAAMQIPPLLPLHAVCCSSCCCCCARSPLVRDVQQVGIHGEGGLAALAGGDLDAPGLGVGDELGPRVEVPLTPGGNDLDVGLQAVVPARVGA
jgi:hypothetical protein